MTCEFRQMLQLSAMGATGHSIDVDCADIDWIKISEIARKQKMNNYLAYSLKSHPELPCPAEIRDSLIRSARSGAFSNAIHRSAVIQLLGKMEAAGIHAVLLKGYAVADCYSIPESRMSSDADIWVEPGDEERACKFMKMQGFAVEPRWKNGHHAVCNHPRIGCVELHVILYDEIVEEVWFGRMDGSEFVIEPHRFVESEDGSYFTLGYTDHFIFLALHMIKHFIISGLTAQMMMDVALYFKKHIMKIDVDRFWKTIDSLHYGKLLNSILWAAIKYCGFSRNDFLGICDHEPEHIEEILSDLEDGGWMGYTDKEAREEGWYEYNRQIMLKSKSGFQYLLYMLKWKSAIYVSALFPDKKTLARRYPYVLERPLLIPYAWFHRLIFRGFKSLQHGALTSQIITNEKLINDKAKARVALFHKLGMM